MKNLKTLVSLGAVAATLSLGSESRADLPPPEGTKFVGYSFTVDGLAAFPDYVVFAYPWSLSNGAPTKEHTVIENGKSVRVGRRSANPLLYAMPKAAYDKWAKTYENKHEYEDPALDALVKRKDVVECSGAPTPRFSLPSDDKRSSITEKLSATKIAAGVCTVSTVLNAGNAEPTPAKKATAPASDTPTPAPATPNTPAAPESASSPPGKSGCGSCAVGSPAGQHDSWLFVSGLLAMLLTRRRRRA